MSLRGGIVVLSLVRRLYDFLFSPSEARSIRQGLRTAFRRDSGLLRAIVFARDPVVGDAIVGCTLYQWANRSAAVSWSSPQGFAVGIDRGASDSSEAGGLVEIDVEAFSRLWDRLEAAGFMELGFHFSLIRDGGHFFLGFSTRTGSRMYYVNGPNRGSKQEAVIHLITAFLAQYSLCPN